MERLLIATDLDRTLLPNGSRPESPGAREAFGRLAIHPDVRTVYVTGRDPDLVDEAIAGWALPAPDLLIADVGTTIATPGPDGWARWDDWDRVQAADWRDLGSGEIQNLLVDTPGLNPQDPQRQTRFKSSWFTPCGDEGREVAAEVRARLEAAGVGANVIASEDETTGTGLLDVLPASASKRSALEFVMNRWKLGSDAVVFAGDSGNDLDLLVSAIPAVLVANAEPEVRETARRLADEAGVADRLYCAKGEATGLNGNYAAGIIEGVLHYHPAWTEVVRNQA